MEVSHSEGRAYRTGPESCVSAREGRGEALTGERAGQVLSYVTHFVRSADAFTAAEGNTAGRRYAGSPLAPRSLRPWHVWKLLVREPGDLTPGRPEMAGPHREGRRAEAGDARG